MTEAEISLGLQWCLEEADWVVKCMYVTLEISALK